MRQNRRLWRTLVEVRGQKFVVKKFVVEVRGQTGLALYPELVRKAVGEST